MDMPILSTDLVLNEQCCFQTQSDTVVSHVCTFMHHQYPGHTCPRIQHTPVQPERILLPAKKPRENRLPSRGSSSTPTAADPSQQPGQLPPAQPQPGTTLVLWAGPWPWWERSAEGPGAKHTFLYRIP